MCIDLDDCSRPYRYVPNHEAFVIAKRKGEFQEIFKNLGLRLPICYFEIFSRSGSPNYASGNGDIRIFNGDKENPLQFKKYTYEKSLDQEGNAKYRFQLIGDKATLVFTRVYSSQSIQTSAACPVDISSTLSPLFQSFGLLPPKCFSERPLEWEKGALRYYIGALLLEVDPDYKPHPFEKLCYHSDDRKETLTIKGSHESIILEKTV